MRQSPDMKLRSHVNFETDSANVDNARFHKIFGLSRRRLNYSNSDFTDYLLMLMLCSATIAMCYRPLFWISLAGYSLCVFMAFSFALRHGIRFSIPLIIRKPKDLLFMVIYKLENLPRATWIAAALLSIEYVFVIYTPQLPHFSDNLRVVGLFLFFLHLGFITIFRTISLFDHLFKHRIVSDVLGQSPWKNAGLVKRNIHFEIFHAYFTGILTHVVLLGPWYFALNHFHHSLILIPITCITGVIIHKDLLKNINSWFYRDHWLGHNSEFDFVYLHGSHHDAIPVGMIAVAGNGFLEGFLRNVIGHPTPLYNPLISFIAYTVEIYNDIAFHQFVPGIYPKLDYEFRQVGQHSTHHFGHLEPYGFAVKLDQPIVWTSGFLARFKNFPDEFRNSAKLDEELTGFKWDNPRHKWFTDICKEHEE